MLESTHRAGLACVGAIVASLAVGLPAQAGFLDSALDDLLAQSAPDDIVSALFYLENQVDTAAIVTELEARGASRATRNRTVLDALSRTAAETQGDFIAALDLLGNGNGVVSHEAFWISNVIRVDATPARITELAARPDVAIAYVNHPIELVAPVGRVEVEPDVAGFGSTPEPGVTAVRAPEAWALGYDGTGIIVANMDTGVDGNHASLASRWLGNDPAYANNPEWAWFDPHDGNNSFPYDEGGHGTHTMGSVCGGAPGDQIGVAPGARWIAAGAIDRPGASIEDTVAYAIESFQWLANPDGNLETSGDVPHVVSNSWGVLDVHGYPACDETFWAFMDNLEAAGCIVVFSAGNEDFDGLRRPSDRATDKFRTFAVAAVDAGNPSWPIAGFSSRGPSTCTPGGLDAIKPDISAPGVSVRSALPGGGYGNLSGTSMASPHINGVLALVLQANPDLTPNQAKNILYMTAIDLGDPGEDNDYGFGMVDAYEAVQAALAMLGISINFPDGRPSLVDPNGGTTFRVVATGQSATPAPGTGTLHYRSGGSGPFTAVAMTEVAPNNYDAIFPAVTCGETVEYYVSVEDTTNAVTYSPTDAPGTVYSAGSYTGIDIAFEHDGQADAGFTVTNTAVDGGAWERGVPAGNGDRGDPLVDGDGSGACWLTENAPDNTDVDGGPTRLFSSVFDASGLNAPELSYQRWMTNDDGDGDRLDIEISNNAGASWELIESVGNSAGWVSVTVPIEDYVTPTAQMQLRFSVSDNPNDSVTEAGIDGIKVQAFACDVTADPCPFDVDDDGEVAFGDILVVLAAWGPCVDCAADVDGNDEVNFEDLLAVLSAWGPCPG